MSSNFPACYLARYSVLLASFLYLATPTLHPAHGPAHALQPLRPRRLAPARSLCLRILLPSLYCASRSRPLSRRRCSSALLRQPLQAAHLALTSPECRSVLVFFFFCIFRIRFRGRPSGISEWTTTTATSARTCQCLVSGAIGGLGSYSLEHIFSWVIFSCRDIFFFA